MTPTHRTKHEEHEMFVDGDKVRVVFEDGTFEGQVLETFITRAQTALRVHLPGRFPYSLPELESWGATISKID